MTKLFESIKKIGSRLAEIDENTDISEVHRLTGLLYEKLSFIKYLETDYDMNEIEVLKKRKIHSEQLLLSKEENQNDEKTQDNNDIRLKTPIVIDENTDKKKELDESFISEVKSNPLKFEVVQDNIETPHSQNPKNINQPKKSEEDRISYHDNIKKTKTSNKLKEKNHINTYNIHETKNTLNDKDDLVYQEAIRIINKTSNIKNNRTKSKTNNSQKKETLEDLLSDYIAEPVFVRREHAKPETFKELYKKNLDIPVSDKLRFIRNLFDDNIEDYLKVITHIQKMESFQDIKDYINEHVKPGFNRWEGKEDYEKDFLNVVEKKFY